ALEAAIRTNPNAASTRFLLAYHYMAEGNTDAAGVQFQEVTKLVPQDQLSSSFAKLYQKATEQKAAADAAPPASSAASAPVQAGGAGPTGSGASPGAVAEAAGGAAPLPAEPESPPPPPSSLVGTWTAKPNKDVAITLTLGKDGAFTWEV